MTVKLDDAIELAKRAGALLRDNFGKRESAAFIGIGRGGDLTRVADKLAEDAIIQGVRELGDSEILSEEAGILTFGQPIHRWIIDPLDGSTNYARRIPAFAVSILVQELPSRAPLYGVIYEPMVDRCFHAERGRGAYLNGERIETNRRRRFENCIFDLDLHFAARSERFHRFLERISKIGPHLVTFRSMGSCALSLSYTAMGELDGFLDLSGNSRFVDIGAGILILKEAGGKVTDIDGNMIAEDYNTVIACASEDLNLWIRSLLREGAEPKPTMRRINSRIGRIQRTLNLHRAFAKSPRMHHAVPA